MPFSSNTFDTVLTDHIVRLGGPVLDVGAGAGKNGNLIKPHNIECHALEPTVKYITDYQLGKIYSRIYPLDIQNYIKTHPTNRYNVAVFGDVLEHLFLTEALDIIDYFCYRTNWLILIFPTNLPQDDIHSNYYEVHKCNLSLKDLSRFDVAYYLKNSGWPVDGGNRCEFHYYVIKGYFADRSKSLYNFKNWQQ